MIKHSKRFTNLTKQFNEKPYSIINGLKEVINVIPVNFLESIELHANLNLVNKNVKQSIRSTVILPYNIGKIKKLGVFANAEHLNTINNLEWIGTNVDELMLKIQNDKDKLDILLTTPDMLPNLAKIGRLLGPKGLMPSLKTGTVTNDLNAAIIEYQKGKIEFRTDKLGGLHCVFGTRAHSLDQLLLNFKTIYSALIKVKPVGVKGTFIKSLYLCSTMSPSVQIDINSIKEIF